VKTNQRMNALMQGEHRIDLPAKLSDLLSAGVVDRDGCVFFAELAKRASNASRSDFPDLTGYECFVNHVHIDDYVEDADPQTLAAMGVTFARRLCELLSERSGDFNVIVGSDELSCSVRFHLVRAGEAWLSDDLESYRDEAIAVLTARPQA
jgi:hypothetical protein